jgi:hypothetical protein
MIGVLVVLLCLLCAGLIAWGLVKRERLLQFPFLAAWAVALQILPQLYAVRSSVMPYPSDGPPKVLLMTLLCLGMTAVGYSMPAQSGRSLRWRFDGRRLLMGAAVLVAIGQLFGFLISRLPEEQTRASQWSGRPVAYVFFARLAPYGLAIALALFLRYRNKWALLLIIPSVVSALSVIVLYGRRTWMAEFFLTLLCFLWFTKKWLPSRPVMIAGILVFAIFVLNAGDYRHAMLSDRDDRWDQVRQIDYMGHLRPDSIAQDSAHEMTNAMYNMSAVARTGEFDLGLSLYNELVGAYVPRQLVGEQIKASLKVPLPDPAFAVYGFEPYVGSCDTGVAQAFVSFSYFGCLLFFLLGYVMRRIWNAAMVGSLPSQVIYVSLLALYLGTYNGSIHNFTVPWVHLAVFLFPVLVYARVRARVPSLPVSHRVTRASRPQSFGTMQKAFRTGRLDVPTLLSSDGTAGPSAT